MTPIAFLNPGAQTAPLREELLRAVTAVIDAGHFILGPNVAALEQEVATFCGAAHGIGVNSGSDALTLALTLALTAPTEAKMNACIAIAAGIPCTPAEEALAKAAALAAVSA